MIYAIEWSNHPILRDLKLNFSNNHGAYNTIVLAGENGTGKTSILNDLSSFLSLNSFSFKKIIYYANEKKFEIYSKQEQDRNNGYHYRIDLNNTEVDPEYIFTNHIVNREKLDIDLNDIRHYGCVFSRAKSGFTTKPVTSSATSQLSDAKYDIDDKEDYTSIKQLLVDLDTQDSADFKQNFMNRKFESGEDAEEAKKTFFNSSRMKRFQAAFDEFFDDLKFSRIDNNDPNEKKVLFKKNNVEIPVDSLSTGEKQIVFRGTYLLKNANNIPNGIVLIDEPELSMHPKWQQKILQFYRNLFSNEAGQFAQIIIATHSDYIVKSAFEKKDEITVISLIKDSLNTIVAKRINSSSILPTISFAEINYKTFGIYTTDFHNALYGHLQEIAISENPDNCQEGPFDQWLVSKGCIQDRNWIAIKRGVVQPARPSTLQTYIRNTIHHPENTHNSSYNEEELKESTEKMIKILEVIGH